MNGKKTGVFLTGILTGALAGVILTVAINLIVGGIHIGGGSTTLISSDIDKKIKTIYSILDYAYVDSYDKTKTVESLYAGLVNGIGDPYTVYMTADQYKKFSEDTEGEYAGIGVVVSVDDQNRIVVVAPFDGSPGAKAGLESKDCIIKVNGQNVYGDALDDAIKLMKGAAGTTVTLTIQRDSDDGSSATFDVNVTRDNIVMDTVSHKMLDNNIGYLRITGFDRVTLQQFQDAYNDLEAQNMKGLILDVRNNPGGLLDVVTDIADILVPKGLIVYTIDNKGNKKVTNSDSDGINVPLLVLVNGSSASASEVLAGAIKDRGVGKLVGETTFGKGLVQNIFEIGDGSALKVTIARYYTPSGVCIQGTGIAPDYPVPMDSALSATISSLTLDQDVQLSAAINIMNGEITK